MIDKKIFMEMLETITKLFKSEKIEKEEFKIYYQFLSEELDTAEFIFCCKKLIKERVYPNFPRIAEILQYKKVENINLEIKEQELLIKKFVSGAKIELNETAKQVVRLAGGKSYLGRLKMTDLENWFKFQYPTLYQDCHLRVKNYPELENKRGNCKIKNTLKIV